ncbi:MAG: molybdopterin-binding protein [Cylindrospermopsis raciborskii KL1]|jgi:molybdopterin-binding protein|uniref:TOBE domain-containing protein n=1 Tax=Cylindrospermopsis raciborskii TaxID=77022 RepID=UPI001A19B845|nr:molybdopterin-binding protein [Cylindrospermopsis raciborskii]MBG0743285.1 molybdopterin-binding protein [Cylindrospermopsis raciborskii KL1]
MPRKEQGWVTFQTSEEERKILEKFCEQSQRSKTEILRELVRGLNQRAPQVSELTEQMGEENIAPKKPLKLSSRNILKGVIKRVTTGKVNTEVTLEIIHRVELTSIITTISAQDLELVTGTEAYAVIKSNDIVIAKD